MLFIRRAAFVGLTLVAAKQAQDSCVADGQSTCADSDTSSMLQSHAHAGSRQRTMNVDAMQTVKLHLCSHDGHDFACNDNHKCCGGLCIPVNAKCCTNEDGVHFQCDEYSSCCGNACAAPGSRCCTNRAGYEYPVSADTLCEDELCHTCTNTYGVDFACGINSTCCGDVCVGEGGACCSNEHGNSFACGAGSSCCGNSCAGEGSVCCSHDGHQYPVAAQTICPTEVLFTSMSSSVKKDAPKAAAKSAVPKGVAELISKGMLKTCSHNGYTTHCPSDQECCGHSCMPANSVCCTNEHDAKFQCGAESTCCGNACAAPGSKCCENNQGYKYPVSEATTCAVDMSITCNTGTHDQVFYCGVNSTCCGDVCVGAGGQCCHNQWGHAFGCGASSACCGNTCAGAGSKCCDVDGTLFPISDETYCTGTVVD